MFSSTPPSKPVVILPLGLLFVPNDQLAFAKLATFIKEDANKAKIEREFLKEAMPCITKLKLGQITESAFDVAMVELVKNILNTTITVEQFNECWFARYHENSVKDLKSITSDSKDYAFEIYSFTNPKDERRMIEFCKEQKINCTVENGHLEKLQNVPVTETFREKISKVELLKNIAKRCKTQEISLVIGSEDGQTISVLKEEAAQLNKLLINTAEALRIHVIKAHPKAALDITKLFEQEKETFVCKL